MSTLRLNVSDLLARPGRGRDEQASLPVEVTLANAAVEGEALIDLTIRSVADGVAVRGTARVAAHLTCNRCLTGWQEVLEVPFHQLFRHRPDVDGDELPVDEGGWIELGATVHDEVSLALPPRPLCRSDCAGLCPTCGTDLNTEPCAGHGEESRSPFAPLKQLFEP